MNEQRQTARLSPNMFKRLLFLGSGAAFLLAGCGARIGVPNPATEQGGEILSLWQLMFWVGVAVGVLMYIAIFWSAIRYRKRKRSERQASQFKNNHVLEITLTIIPFIIVVLLMVPTVMTGEEVNKVSEEPDLTVNVTAFQWSWRFQYLGSDAVVTGTPDDIPTLALPVDESIRIVLDSVDVDHSFYIPEFLFKRDAIPGHTNIFDFNVDRAGKWTAQCAEFCGHSHAFMLFEVEAMERADFDRWVAARAAETKADQERLDQDQQEIDAEQNAATTAENTGAET